MGRAREALARREAREPREAVSATVRAGAQAHPRAKAPPQMTTAPAPYQLEALKTTSAKKATVVILAISLAALLLLVAVIYGHGRATDVPTWVSWLPALNAFLNATSAVFLVLAYRAIRRRDVATHARRMLGALGASTLFLVSYIVYHSVHGDTKFTGVGAVRPIYFFILVTHIVLSAAVLPLIFFSLFFSLSARFPRHKAIARYTLPIWLYVSVTGVLVFALLRAYG
jgi:putative membrane protein